MFPVWMEGDERVGIALVVVLAGIVWTLGYVARSEELSGRKGPKAAAGYGLPGTLAPKGACEEPALGKDPELFRDFARLYGAGTGILVHQSEGTTLVPLTPGASCRATGDVTQEKVEGALQDFHRNLRELLPNQAWEAGTAERLARRMTVDAALTFAMSMGINPPQLYQPTYLITAGAVGVYLTIYAFVGGPAQGDRPDRKHTPYYIKICTQNLATSEAQPTWAYSVFATQLETTRACVEEQMA